MISSIKKLDNNLGRVKGMECITIGRQAPDFTELSTQGYVRMSDYKGKWVLFTSHPMSFTAVSTTELIDVAQLYPEFLKRNVVVISLTTDNVYANLAWVIDIYKKTGITIPFPIIGDAELKISELYGMLNADRMYGETVRNAFIINPFGKIKAILTLPVSCGRSGTELLRIIDSLQITENYNLHTPAEWDPGEPLVLPTPSSYNDVVNRVNNEESLGYQCPFWYLCYTNINQESTNKTQ